MPDRHIFEVASDGGARGTGATAPVEPSRAIVTVNEAPPPAVEAPPPSLSVREEAPKPTKPARRRRVRTQGVAGELEGAASALALPTPEKKPRRTRKRAEPPSETPATVAPVEPQAKPKATRKRKAASTASRKKSSTR